MPNLTIIADIQAHPEKVDLLKTELENLIPTTRAEAGCIQYDLHQDNENPGHFLFFEIWASWELWQDHLNAPHLTAFKAATVGAVAKTTISEMTHVA